MIFGDVEVYGRYEIPKNLLTQSQRTGLFGYFDANRMDRKKMQVRDEKPQLIGCGRKDDLLPPGRPVLQSLVIPSTK